MSITIEPNSGGEILSLDITCENDDGIFLSIAAQNEDGDDVLDYIISDQGEIQRFFAMVIDAQQAWGALIAKL